MLNFERILVEIRVIVLRIRVRVVVIRVTKFRVFLVFVIRG